MNKRDVRIRPMEPGDGEAVLAMMRVFYASPAVLSNGSEEIYRRDVAACLEPGSGVTGWVLEAPGAAVVGYAMTARSFSTEYGGPCLWIEDLYIMPEYRGHGLGSAMLRHIEERNPDAVIFRLEAEAENRANHAYARCGYEVFPYVQMKKSRG